MIKLKNISEEDFIKMTAEEQFNLIDVDTIIKMSDELFENNKKK